MNFPPRPDEALTFYAFMRTWADVCICGCLAAARTSFSVCQLCVSVAQAEPGV